MVAITFFSMPKAFEGVYDTIQKNAIRSWMSHANSSVLLLGDDTGVKDFARLIGCHHISSVNTNDLGTPLVNDIVRRASEHAITDWVAYVNADIIIPPNLGEVINSLLPEFDGPVVFACRRWDIDITDPIDFSTPSWFHKLDQSTTNVRTLYGVNGMDLFVFPKGFYNAMPPFSIGWPGAKYDNWFVWYARHNRVPVVDITDAITLFHQKHPPGGGATHPNKMREHTDNLKHIGGYGNCFDIRDASHRVDVDGKIRFVRMDIPYVVLTIKRMIQRLRDFFVL